MAAALSIRLEGCGELALLLGSQARFTGDEMKQLLVAIVLGANAVGANAQFSSASLRWGQVSFTLTDLDTEDGASPYLNAIEKKQCVNNGFPICPGYTAVQPTYRPTGGTGTYGTGPIGPTFDFASFLDSTRFELSAHTRLTITGAFSGSGTGPQTRIVDDLYDGLRYTYRTFAFANGLATLDEMESGLSTGVGDSSAPFALTIESGDDARIALFTVDMGIGGGWSRTVEPIPAIPEPSTLALFGIGALALMARRDFAKKEPSAQK